MHHSPSRSSNISDITDGSSTHVGSTYEPLNVNGHDTKQPTYQPLTREPLGPRGSVYEDPGPKPPAKEPPGAGYASLGKQDEQKPYMTVTHAT